jgi:hypothetical protein
MCACVCECLSRVCVFVCACVFSHLLVSALCAAGLLSLVLLVTLSLPLSHSSSLSRPTTCLCTGSLSSAPLPWSREVPCCTPCLTTQTLGRVGVLRTQAKDGLQPLSLLHTHPHAHARTHTQSKVVRRPTNHTMTQLRLPLKLSLCDIVPSRQLSQSHRLFLLADCNQTPEVTEQA